MEEIIKKVIAPIGIGGTVEIKKKEAEVLLETFHYKSLEIGESLSFMGRTLLIV
jgi:hypothetical protein